MIKKRVENGGIVNAIYESSNILASKYDLKTKALTITFNYGGQYTYNDVPLTDYTRFESESSQGVVFNSHIKNKYETINEGKVDVTLIKESLNQAIKDEVGEYLASMMEDVGDLIEGYVTNRTVEVYRLDDLVARFEVYKGLL